MSELEVALDRYTHSCCWLLYHWNDCQKSEENGCDAVQEWMEVEYCYAWSQLTIIWQLFGWYIYNPVCVVVTDVSDVRADLTVRLQAVKTLLKKINVSLANRNVAITSRSVLMVCELLKPSEAGWSPEKATPRFTFSNQGSYFSHRISLILLHMFEKRLIALSFSTSHGSQKEYCICIQLVRAIVLNLHKTLLRPLLDSWLLLVVKFVPYMNRAISLDTDPATSLSCKSTGARTNHRDMTAEHAISCLCDKLKCSVDESGCLEDGNQIFSKLTSCQDDVARSRKPLQAHLYIWLGCPPYLQSPEPLTHPPHLCYRIAWPLMMYSTLSMLVHSNEHSISTTQSLTTVENLQCNVMLSGCQNQSSRMVLQSRCWFYRSASGPRMTVLESANAQQTLWGFGRRKVAWKHNGKIIKWRSVSGRLPTPWASATRKAPALSNAISWLIVALLESGIWPLKGCFGNGTRQTGLTSMVRNSRQHRMSSRRSAFAEGCLGLTKPWLRCGNLSTLVCISPPQFCFCSSG